MTDPRDDSADGAHYPPAPAPAPEPYTGDDAPSDPPPPWFAGHRSAGTTAQDALAPTGPSPEATAELPGPPPAPAPASWPTPSAPETSSPPPGFAWSTPSSRDYQPTASYPPSAAPKEYAPGDYAAAPQEWTAWADVRGTGQEPVAAAPDPARRRKQRRRREGRTVGLAVVVLLVLLALVAGTLTGRYVFPSHASSLPTTSSTASEPPARAPESVAGIAAAALDSTVFIQVFGRSAASSGSGMVLREDGYIVTNNHVIAPAGDDGRVTVTFADGSEETAQIVGRTVEYDLAVLRVDRDGLVPLVLADSADVVVGDPAVAVGAPLGLEGTVTTGIISALNRPVQAGGSEDGASSFINAIQTDAAINPGNSGGPLLNLDGEVVGINTAIAQASGRETGSIGLGFAIPADQVRRTAEQIIAEGRATYPVIGVALDTQYQGEGVQVLEQDTDATEAVTSGGPSDLAGIEAGDVITQVDGAPVTSPSELIVAVRARAPGESVTLTVRRGEDEREVEVVLGEEVSD